jgi:PAT family acetyl-CoA transporter-like MFS transporter 1
MPLPLRDSNSSVSPERFSLHEESLPLQSLHRATPIDDAAIDHSRVTSQSRANKHTESKEQGDTFETRPLVEGGDSEDTDSEVERDSQMPRKKAAPKDLNVATSGSSFQGAESNGYSEDMNNAGVELRRKNASMDSPQAQAAHLMGRESFSLDDEPPPTPKGTDTSFYDLPRQDKRNFMLLVLLYFLQGVPMGLAGGSVPFLLKRHLSYGQIGVYSLASYPYSLKLLWSPIVDAVWTPRLGRRKSWILPIQFCSAFGLLYMGSRATQMMKDAAAPDGSGIWVFTYWWFMLVFLCATQDIAVDGWALTLLSPPNISYASTAQTVGLTAGQFMSYTVFLAFNAPEFANKYFRQVPSEEGVITLGGYMTFWGWAYLIVTLGLALLKREDKTKERDGIMEVYRSMWGILKLRNIQSIIIVHLIAKIGFQANDAVTNLKLIDKGFSQEDLALTVLIDFPFEITLGYYAGRWSAAYPALHVWLWAFLGRLVAAAVAQGVVMMFPVGGTTTGYLLTVIVSHVYSTFTSTVMFVAVSAFHARIADPTIGGTYMTLLAT